MSTKAPLRTALSDTYPNPSNAVLRTGMGALWDFIKAKLGIDVAPVSIASSATVNIGAADSTNITITGTTTISAFDTVEAGIKRDVTFSGALTLTHNATSLILPGGANITASAGDCATFLSLGSGNWRCIKYQKSVSPMVSRVTGYLVSEQNVAAANTWTPVQFVKSGDALTEYDNATHTFTAQQPGDYLIGVALQWGLGASGDWGEAAIHKNGSRVKRWRSSVADTTSALVTVGGSHQFTLAAGDTITFYGQYNSSTSDRKIRSTGDAELSSFFITKL